LATRRPSGLVGWIAPSIITRETQGAIVIGDRPMGGFRTRHLDASWAVAGFAIVLSASENQHHFLSEMAVMTDRPARAQFRDRILGASNKT